MLVEEYCLADKAEFLKEVTMARFSRDAMLVQAALLPDVRESIVDLAERVFGHSTAASQARTQSACASLVKFDRVVVSYEHGRVSHVTSKDSSNASWRQLDGSMNLSARAGHQSREQDTEERLRALYGEL